MEYSSRKKPCPICGRFKDADCRWNDEVIFCHKGSNFAPPSHLKIGDVLTVNSLNWALVKVNAGHSGRAHVFVPHRPIKKNSIYSSATYREQLQKRNIIFRETVSSFENYLKISKSLIVDKDYQKFNLNEIRRLRQQINIASQYGIELKKIMIEMRRNDKRYTDYIELIDQRHKEIIYLKKNFESFFLEYLGDIA